MIAQIHTDSLVIERLQKAMNNHDLEAFVECFNPDYQSEQPVHPDRRFRGRNRSGRTGLPSSAVFGTFRRDCSEAQAGMMQCGLSGTGMVRSPME